MSNPYEDRNIELTTELNQQNDDLIADESDIRKLKEEIKRLRQILSDNNIRY